MSSPTGAWCAIHPETGAVATCDHCGTFACAECITRHGERQICATCIAEKRVVLEQNPWDAREETGYLLAWWRTVVAVSASPGRFFTSLHGKEGLGAAAAFASATLVPALFMAWVYQTAMLAAYGDVLLELFQPFLSQAELPPELVTELDKAFKVTPGSLVQSFVSSVGFGVPIGLFIVVFFAVIQHLILVLIGGDEGGLEVTLKAAFYSCGVRFWEVIPLVNFVSILWILAVQGIGYSTVHQTDGWKGQLAAWGPALGCCCCLLGVPFLAGTLGALIAGAA